MLKGEDDAFIILGFLPSAISITVSGDYNNNWIDFEFPTGNIRMYNTKFESVLSVL